ncbi:MAG: adenosylmethionine--8-amino-7-oxononanoate transaminase [Nitrosomonas sp.]|nr:adenosylmethionine--8-amino-7-oxononanoate transaminase [Nitrosomonas sp.]
MSNKKLSSRSDQAVWHPCTQMKDNERFPLLAITKGIGAWLYDQDGNRYLDTISSWWVNLFGHCNPRINAAIIDQLGKIEHVLLAGCTHEPVVLLSERLAKLAPGDLGHCFYASDGASATEIALKMSFQYWQQCGSPTKKNYISLQNGYHGETLGALSVTDVPLFKQTYAPLLLPSITVPTPDWRQAINDETPYDCALRAAAALEQRLEQHHAEIAALILEPLVQGAIGMGMYHPVYLERARQLCDRYQVHLIADEIAIGFGRTGTMFACEQASITPDFLCLAKGLSGGYLPLSVVMTTNNIYAAFYDDLTSKAFLHSHSHSGNALACRAALATLDIFEQDNVLASNAVKTRLLNQYLQPVKTHPKVENFRNCGMIWAFDARDPVANFANRFAQLGLKQQLLIRPIGRTVYIIPPYILEENDIQLIANGILQILDQLTVS